MGKGKQFFMRRESAPAPTREEVKVAEPKAEEKKVYIIREGCTTLINGWRYTPGQAVELTDADAEKWKSRIRPRAEMVEAKDRLLRDARYARQGA